MIQEQIGMLKKDGYPAKDIYTFILYNWNHDFQTCETKRLRCWKWGVQISDCRFRPLDRLSDHYEPRKVQTSKDYFIHPSWTDEEVKLFRANVRKHNICVRHGFRFHSRTLEHMRLPKWILTELNKMPKSAIKQTLPDAWFPEEYHGPDRKQSRIEKFNQISTVAEEELTIGVADLEMESVFRPQEIPLAGFEENASERLLARASQQREGEGHHPLRRERDESLPSPHSRTPPPLS
jgi:hypothetical protein